MLNITDNTAMQIFNTGVNAAILVAIIRATRAVTRVEFKVEMMWKVFSRNIGIPEAKD